jgi:hypothetical protein
MAEAGTTTKTKSGTCPTHGMVQATRAVPAFAAPGLFWLFQYLAATRRPYLCPQCGQAVARA